MNWFYAFNGQQAGPVDDAELERLVLAGTVTPATLVWYRGLAQWQPYSEARLSLPPAVGQSNADATTLAPATGTAEAAASGAIAAQAQCSQCGRVLPADDIVRVDNLNVCGDCKPLLLQRMREGVPVYNSLAPAAVYAGFWIRLGAAFLDSIILIPFYIVLLVGIFFFTDLHNTNFADAQSVNTFKMMRANLPWTLSASVLLACYSAFCISRFGGTPGKRICNLRVVHGGEGRRVTFARALGRFAAKRVPGMIPIFGLIYAIVDGLFIVFDAQNRALHDMICDTRVVVEAPPR